MTLLLRNLRSKAEAAGVLCTNWSASVGNLQLHAHKSWNSGKNRNSCMVLCLTIHGEFRIQFRSDTTADAQHRAPASSAADGMGGVWEPLPDKQTLQEYLEA